MDATNVQEFVIKKPLPHAQNRLRCRQEPTTLLEEYDPYIAGLIRKLQDEVRMERSRCRWQYPQSTH